MNKAVVFICGLLATTQSFADDRPLSSKIFKDLDSENSRNMHLIYFETQDNPDLGKIQFSKDNEYFGPPNTGNSLSSDMGQSPGWARINAKPVQGVDPSSGITIYDPKKKKKRKK